MASSDEAFRLARIRYDRGLTDFIAVLDAERVLNDLEDHYVLSETNVMLGLIGIYKSLGGGWESYSEHGADDSIFVYSD